MAATTRDVALLLEKFDGDYHDGMNAFVGVTSVLSLNTGEYEVEIAFIDAQTDARQTFLLEISELRS